MALSNLPFYPQAVKAQNVQIANGDGQTFKVAYTAGTNGSKILAIIVSSTDTSARDITIAVNDGSITPVYAQINIPITAGNVNTAPAVNALSSANFPGLPLDNDGNPYLYIPSGDKIEVNAPVTVTTAKFLQVLVIAVDF